jgi:hypothetical protein
MSSTHVEVRAFVRRASIWSRPSSIMRALNRSARAASESNRVRKLFFAPLFKQAGNVRQESSEGARVLNKKRFLISQHFEQLVSSVGHLFSNSTLFS